MAGYTEKQKRLHDREEAEEEASDRDRPMGASEEKMEERVEDDVVRSRQINRDSQEGREAVCVCVCARERTLCAPHVITK